MTDRRNRRSLNRTIVLHVPASVVTAKSAPYLSRGKPACRNPMVNDGDYNIVALFGAEYRGIVQYYLLAGDVFRLHRLRWVMETSMLKTLARKHRSTVTKMAARHKAKISTPHGQRTRFGARIERPGKKPLGRLVRRHSAQAAEARGPDRPPARRGPSTRTGSWSPGCSTAAGPVTRSASPRDQQLIALLIEDPPVPYAEISARLGIPVGSIGPSRRRCLDELRHHPAVANLISAEAQTA